MRQSPQAPEDRSVSAPVVTVEASEQFTTYVGMEVRSKSAHVSGSDNNV